MFVQERTEEEEAVSHLMQEKSIKPTMLKKTKSSSHGESSMLKKGAALTVKKG